MKSKQYLKKKRLLNQLYIKMGIIHSGNDSKRLKEEFIELSKQIKKIKIYSSKVE
jgi:hypothetical protein